MSVVIFVLRMRANCLALGLHVQTRPYLHPRIAPLLGLPTSQHTHHMTTSVAMLHRILGPMPWDQLFNDFARAHFPLLYVFVM